MPTLQVIEVATELLKPSEYNPRNINFYFTFSADEKTTLTATIGINAGIAGKSLDFWCNNPDRQQEVLSAIQTELGLATKQLPPDSDYGIVARWELAEIDIHKLVELFRKLSSLV